MRLKKLLKKTKKVSQIVNDANSLTSYSLNVQYVYSANFDFSSNISSVYFHRGVSGMESRTRETRVACRTRLAVMKTTFKRHAEENNARAFYAWNRDLRLKREVTVCRTDRDR